MPQHLLVVAKDTGGEELVERHQQQSHAQPSEEGHAHLQVEQVEGDGELQRQAPQLVETSEEVDHAVGVRAHQVHHLPQRGAGQAAAADPQGFAVNGRHQGGARRQRHLGHLEDKDVLEEGREEGGGEEPQRAPGAPADRSAGVLHEVHQTAEEQRAREAQHVHRHLQRAERVVTRAEGLVQHPQQAHVALQRQRLLLVVRAPGAAQEVPADRPGPLVPPVSGRRASPAGFPALVEVAANHGGSKFPGQVIDVGRSVQLPPPAPPEERRQPEVEEPRDAAAAVLGHHLARVGPGALRDERGSVRVVDAQSVSGIADAGKRKSQKVNQEGERPGRGEHKAGRF